MIGSSVLEIMAHWSLFVSRMIFSEVLVSSGCVTSSFISLPCFFLNLILNFIIRELAVNVHLFIFHFTLIVLVCAGYLGNI